MEWLRSSFIWIKDWEGNEQDKLKELGPNGAVIASIRVAPTLVRTAYKKCQVYRKTSEWRWSKCWNQKPYLQYFLRSYQIVHLLRRREDALHSWRVSVLVWPALVIIVLLIKIISTCICFNVGVMCHCEWNVGGSLWSHNHSSGKAMLVAPRLCLEN